jgi:hypothetical protein
MTAMATPQELKQLKESFARPAAAARPPAPTWASTTGARRPRPASRNSMWRR